MFPHQIKIVDKAYLYIKWDDNLETKIKLADLRYNCPCAVCLAERKEKSNSYIPIFSDEQITIQEIKLAGNYAINIVWKDFHNTGIYDFDYLRKLSI